MKLHTTLASPYARKVRVVLAEKRIDFDLVINDVWKPDNTVALYNPLGKIPVLVLDDGTALYDSSVIAEYLDGITPVSRLLPEGGRERALVKRLESLGDGIIDCGVLIFLERMRDVNLQNNEAITRHLAKIESGIAAAARELGERKYFHAETFQLGDIALACALLWISFRLPEVKWRETYTNLSVWIERLESRTAFADSKPVSSPRNL